MAWARLVSFDYERQAAQDPEHPGIPLDTTERRESGRILREARLDPLGLAPMEAVFDSRQEAMGSANLLVLVIWAGEYASSATKLEVEAESALARGQFARAARAWAMAAHCHVALGRLDQARAAQEQAAALAARVGQPIFPALQAQELLTLALNEGWEELLVVLTPLAQSSNPAFSWVLGLLYSWTTRAAARLGRADEALGYLERLVPWLERAPAWTIAFPCLPFNAGETLWLLERLDHAAVVERALREKVLRPDFRMSMTDGRLALARICALQSRWAEATQWFADSRSVLKDQGARPMLAIADHDEALMYVRRGEPGDLDRARPLLDAAQRQFEAIGMTGWIRQAEELRKSLA